MVGDVAGGGNELNPLIDEVLGRLMARLVMQAYQLIGAERERCVGNSIFAIANLTSIEMG